MSEDNSHDKSLEERIRKRSEMRRKRALESLPAAFLYSILESSPQPIIVYENNQVSYANPTAITKLGYRFDELMTFNDVTLDTGARKERLDHILTPCAQQGWDELDIELSITTLDKKELRLQPHLHHERVGPKEYWIAYIVSAEKIDPHTLKGKALNALQRFQRVFQRERTYLKAPEYIDKEFIVDAIRKGVASASANLVIDLKRTRGVDEDVLPVLHEFTKASSFKDQLFLINADESLYRFLMHHKIPSETIHRARRQAYAPSPA